jgi:hypothetical protein
MSYPVKQDNYMKMMDNRPSFAAYPLRLSWWMNELASIADDHDAKFRGSFLTMYVDIL